MLKDEGIGDATPLGAVSYFVPGHLPGSIINEFLIAKVCIDISI